MILDHAMLNSILPVIETNSKFKNVSHYYHEFERKLYPEISPKEFLIISIIVVYGQYNYSMIYQIVKRVHPMVSAMRLYSIASLYVSVQRYMYNIWLQNVRREKEKYNSIINMWFKMHFEYEIKPECNIGSTFFIDRVNKMKKRFFSLCTRDILSLYLKSDYFDVFQNKDTGIFSYFREQRNTVCDLFKVQHDLSDFPLNS